MPRPAERTQEESHLGMVLAGKKKKIKKRLSSSAASGKDIAKLAAERGSSQRTLKQRGALANRQGTSVFLACGFVSIMARAQLGRAAEVRGEEQRDKAKYRRQTALLMSVPTPLVELLHLLGSCRGREALTS